MRSHELVPITEGEILVPEERAIEMIEACARQIQAVTSIPDVMRVITKAEAIDAVMKKIKASKDVKRAALVLLVEAEQQLGRISKQLPQAKRGAAARKFPGQIGKKDILRNVGVNHRRAYTAEKLADAPAEAINVAIDSARNKSVSGVTAFLGYRTEWPENGRRPSTEFVLPEKRARDLAFLADESISHAEACIQSKTSPHAGTVAEMRTRLMRLRST